MKEFVIDRALWLRGSPHESTLLDQKTERMCCLGHYCIAASRSPIGVRFSSQRAWDLIPELLGGATGNSPLSCKAMEINDDAEIDDDGREAQLIELFARHGVELRFV